MLVNIFITRPIQFQFLPSVFLLACILRYDDTTEQKQRHSHSSCSDVSDPCLAGETNFVANEIKRDLVALVALIVLRRQRR